MPDASGFLMTSRKFPPVVETMAFLWQSKSSTTPATGTVPSQGLTVALV